MNVYLQGCDIYIIVTGKWAETVINITKQRMKQMQKSKKERTFKANIIIFTSAFDLNKKWLTKEPEMVVCVTGQFNVLALEFNKAFEKDIVYVDEDIEEVQKSVWIGIMGDKHKKMPPGAQTADLEIVGEEETEVQASILGNKGALTFQ